ncbi:hypothetical protein OBBRIDRAFT_662667 [Obba rivulosa]|uniref:Uncharacterized protein n=1 Tax=Obba rivulosa TaxID=1052685 RepID=A0A8E2AWS9_9APHY|nr:hypothetical protein OBBRIDRAFT_662667 [Obba rivulosa]
MCPNVLILKASLSSTMALNISHPPIGSHSASVWSIEYPYLEIIVVLLLFIVQILMPSDLCREDIVGVELNLEHGATSRNNGSAIPIFSTPNDQLQWPFEGIADFAYHDPVLLRASRKIITSKPALRAHESSPVALTTCGEAFRDVRQAVHKGDSVLQSAEDLDASIRYISPFNTSRHDLDKWEHSAWRTPKSFPASVVPNLNFGSGLADDVIVCMQTTSSVNMPPPPGQDMSRSMHSMNRPPIQFGLCDNTGVFDSVRSLPDALDSSFRTHADGQGFVTDSADGKIVVISGNDAESSDFARILDTSTPDSIVGGSCSRTKDLSATDTSLTSSVLADDPRPLWSLFHTPQRSKIVLLRPI